MLCLWCGAESVNGGLNRIRHVKADARYLGFIQQALGTAQTAREWTVTAMYEGLIKALRCLRIGCGDCPMQYMELVEADHTHHSYVQRCIAHKAADAIEELAKDLERSRNYETFWKKEAEEALRRFQVAVANKPRWISVEERVPDGEVLAVNALRGSYGYREYLIGYIGKHEESDSGYSCESEGEILLNVTHWMQLPEPPREDKTS